jgi:hypothetical protein
MVLFCCCLPMLHPFGYWDRYLSFSMYSGGVPQLYICTNNERVLQEYAVFMGNHKNGLLPCSFPIPVYRWSNATIYASPNPERRVYLAIAKQFTAKHPGVEASYYLYHGGFSPKLELLQLR